MRNRWLLTGFITLLVLWIVTPTSSACVICKRSITMVWPVAGSQLAGDALDSLCTSPDAMWGHEGTDLYSPDGAPVYAAFDGRVERYFENDTTDTALNWRYNLKYNDDPPYYFAGLDPFYHLGRYIRLVGEDLDGNGVEEFDAIYGHLMEEGLAIDQEKVTRGDVLGYSGGGQDHVNIGDSPGPRLYFELFDYNANDYVDPFTCVANTCDYWYTDQNDDQCIPNLDNTEDCWVTPDPSGNYNIPAYACTTLPDPTTPWGGVTIGGLDVRYIAKISIDKYGKLDLGCRGTGADENCSSEVYDHNLQPLIGGGGGAWKNIMDCFLYFLRAYNDGKYRCGEIIPGGDFVWYPYAMDDCQGMITSIGMADKTESRNLGLKRIFQIDAGSIEENAKYITVGNEYHVIGVNDKNYVDQVAAGRKIHDANPPGGIGNFMPQADSYYMDYIMIRTCDFTGLWNKKAQCKEKEIAGVVGKYQETTPDYNERIEDGGYESCIYWVEDAGKFYDEPGRFIATNWLGRLGANRGLMWYT